MGGTDRIAGLPVGLEVGGALVELPAVSEADAVHHQMTMEMVRVDVGGHQYLEVGKLPLGQLQSDGVGLLGCQAVLLAEGLDEVVVLPSVRFPVPLLGEPHLRAGALGGAVPPGHQPLSFPQGLFLLTDVAGDAAQCATASAPVFDCGECGHLRSPPAGAAEAAR